MERIKNKLWRRSQSQSNTDSMDTSSRVNPEDFYLNLSLNPTSNSPSMSSLSGNQQGPSTSTGNPNSVTQSDAETLTQELSLVAEQNRSLEEAVQTLTAQLTSLQESQSALISKSEDLTQSLELERKRFLWQKVFYEKKILDLALGKISYTNDASAVDSKAVLESISNSFYHETIMELAVEQENQKSQIAEIKSSFEEEVKRLTQKHEADIYELVESNHEQVKLLVQTHEELIKDLLTGCEGIFDEMKLEYLRDSELNKELKTKSGLKIWDQFMGEMKVNYI